MSKHRNELKIIADVLHAAGRGSKKTRIMYLANLSYLLLKKYLHETIRAGLLQSSAEGYAVTKKGEDFMENYARFADYSSRIEKDMEVLRNEEGRLLQMCSGRRNRRCGQTKKGRVKLVALG